MSTTFDPAGARVTLFAAMLEAARRHGTGTPVIEDSERQPLTYGRLILGSIVLGGKLAEQSARGETVGLLLPNVNAMAVTLMGLNAWGRVAALLNFTAGVRNLEAALDTARIGLVVTSRRFVDTAKLDDVVAAMASRKTASGEPVRVLYLEDVRKTISAGDKIMGLVRSKLPARWHRKHAQPPDEPAVILFTSGTEGLPKAVVLSSTNLVANAGQIFAHATPHFTSADVAFNPLPMFHSFGLTAGTIMPMLNGMRAVLYPSPLHYKQITKLIRDTGATVLFATDTFAQGYARAAETGDLASLRFIICGAERVKESTRALYDKAGTLLLEGYGATECSPVLACNLPDRNRPGTVGPLLPGIETRLEPVEGIAEGGRLEARGPNVMLGYMMHDRPGVIVPPRDGWHDTGDIVSVDDGFITIRGRAKRFAKIGGEMVSLAAVEAMTSTAWPDSNHVCVSLPDPRRGEQLVLVTDKADADKESLLAAARKQGFPELWVPKVLMVVGSIPVMGSGKVDLRATLQLVRETRPLL